jgi:hypothetical protein
LHIYNRSNPLSVDRSGRPFLPLVSEEQHRTSVTLAKRPARTPDIDREFFAAHLFEFMKAASLNNRFVAKVEARRIMQAARVANPGK